MGILDNIGESQVDVRQDIVERTSGPWYDVNYSADIEDLLRSSQYQVNILFRADPILDELVNICEKHSRELIEDLASIPEISGLSDVLIVWNKYTGNFVLMIGMDFDIQTPYSAIWTFSSIIDILKRVGLCSNALPVCIWYMVAGRINEILEYGDYIESYNILTDNRFTKGIWEKHRKLFGHIIGRLIGDGEWKHAVDMSYKRYNLLHPENME